MKPEKMQNLKNSTKARMKKQYLKKKGGVGEKEGCPVSWFCFDTGVAGIVSCLFPVLIDRLG